MRLSRVWVFILGFKCPSLLIQPNLDLPVDSETTENKTGPLGVQMGTAGVRVRGAGLQVYGRWQCASRNSPELQVPRAGRIRGTSILLLFPKYNLSFIGKRPASDFYLDPIQSHKSKVPQNCPQSACLNFQGQEPPLVHRHPRG